MNLIWETESGFQLLTTQNRIPFLQKQMWRCPGLSLNASLKPNNLSFRARIQHLHLSLTLSEKKMIQPSYWLFSDCLNSWEAKEEKLVGSTLLDRGKQNHITLTVIYSISTHCCLCQRQQQSATIGKGGEQGKLGARGENPNFYFPSQSLKVGAPSTLS